MEEGQVATIDDDDASTVARSVELPSGVPSATFAVHVVDGPCRGQTYVLDGTQPSSTLLGTSSVCELRLTDPLVSRRHASFDQRNRELRLVDLESTNGTFVNGVRIVDIWLRGGELVRVGDTTLQVELADATTVIQLPSCAAFGRMLGGSSNMRRIYPLCERLAATDVPVLIEGETGTGKELLAEALHEQGPRASRPFVVFDCTAVLPNLAESELFGHERGAFTGAVATRKGVFEQAHGGTLLIDEIGDLDLAVQPKLLRALERGEIRRVGGESPIHVDVRLLCATRRDLDREVQTGRFRDDLFHRLAVARIELPPLRRRRADIATLARAFWKAMGGDAEGLPQEFLTRWEELPWPGNVRELRNAVARRIALGDLASVPARESLAPNPAQAATAAGEGALERIIAQRLPFSSARQRVLDEFERRYMELVLAEHDGNVMRAAAASGVARRHFQRVRGRVDKAR